MRRDEDMEKGNPVSFVGFEVELARAERHIRRLWIGLIATILALGLSNIAWFIFFILH